MVGTHWRGGLVGPKTTVDNFKENISLTPAGNRTATLQFRPHSFVTDDLWSLLTWLLAPS
jgi:hypothetical protein